jgi:hypothetical protein
MNNQRCLRFSERLGNENGQGSNMVTVRVRYHNITNGPHFLWRQGQSDASSIYGETIVDEERRQCLKLYVLTSATAEKSNSQ